MSDLEFLDMVARDSFRFFVSEANPENGLVKDSSREYSPCSIASVGFGLTALCIGVENGWIPKNEAYIRIERTLRTFRDKLPHEHGFFYHFLNINSGARIWESEVSSVDTALFLAGALTAGEYFKGTEIEKLAGDIYARVDWPWMLNGRRLLCMGWKPESGFLPYYWDSYNELMIIYALAIGSPTHPIAADLWNAWGRPRGKYGNYSFVYCYSNNLFVYQYSHAWIDFRNMRDSYADYWDNSVAATLANRQYCIDMSDNFEGFGENMWGLTACVGPDGYKAYGGGPVNSSCDGTIAPCAAAGSIPFAPAECMGALRAMYDEYGDELYGKYGFKDAFNLSRNWWANEYLGIDQGITVLMIENYRTGFVWKYFMRNPAVKKWQALCFKMKD